MSSYHDFVVEDEQGPTVPSCQTYDVIDTFESTRERPFFTSSVSGFVWDQRNLNYRGTCEPDVEFYESKYFPAHGNPTQWLPAHYEYYDDNGLEWDYWTSSQFVPDTEETWGYANFNKTKTMADGSLKYLERSLTTTMKIRSISPYSDERGVEVIAGATYYIWNQANFTWETGGTIPPTMLQVNGQPLDCMGHRTIKVPPNVDIDITPTTYIYEYYTYYVYAYTTKDLHFTYSYHPTMGVPPSVPERHGDFFADYDPCRTENEVAGNTVLQALDGVSVPAEFHIYDSLTPTFPFPFNDSSYNVLTSGAQVTALLYADFANIKQVQLITAQFRDSSGALGVASTSQPKIIMQADAHSSVWKHEIVHTRGIDHRPAPDTSALMNTYWTPQNSLELNRLERAIIAP